MSRPAWARGIAACRSATFAPCALDGRLAGVSRAAVTPLDVALAARCARLVAVDKKNATKRENHDNRGTVDCCELRDLVRPVQPGACAPASGRMALSQAHPPVLAHGLEAASLAHSALEARTLSRAVGSRWLRAPWASRFFLFRRLDVPAINPFQKRHGNRYERAMRKLSTAPTLRPARTWRAAFCPQTRPPANSAERVCGQKDGWPP